MSRLLAATGRLFAICALAPPLVVLVLLSWVLILVSDAVQTAAEWLADIYQKIVKGEG
jgi:hypothetical protein